MKLIMDFSKIISFLVTALFKVTPRFFDFRGNFEQRAARCA